MTLRATLACCVISLCLVMGCDQPAPGGGGGDGGRGTDGGGTPVDGGGTPIDGGGTPVDGGGAMPLSLTFGPVRVGPALENTQCVIVRLGNTTPIHVGRIRNVLGGGSHHFIIYRTNETMERTTPFDCQPFVDTLDPAAGSPLMITQRAEETLTLPPGVAFTLEANQMIRLEMHYINYEAEPVDISATATFYPMPDAEFMHEADFLFIGNPDIDIPARSMATLGPTFFRPPSMLSGANFFGITGHTHQYGTNVQVWTAMGTTGSATPVYDVAPWNWDEPETVYHTPAFQVPSGGGFRFTCTYNNTSPSRVGFGESADQEMCFFWAYYYPSVGAFVCAHTDQIPGGADICCPGSPACGLLFR